jgi:hypothetical protein
MKNKLIKVKVQHSNNMWILKPIQYKDGSQCQGLGEIRFRGDIDAFSKYLIKIKAKDTESEPASIRNVPYKSMAQDAIDKVDTEIWVWSRFWNPSTDIMGEQEMKEKSLNQQYLQQLITQSGQSHDEVWGKWRYALKITSEDFGTSVDNFGKMEYTYALKIAIELLKELFVISNMNKVIKEGVSFKDVLDTIYQEMYEMFVEGENNESMD